MGFRSSRGLAAAPCKDCKERHLGCHDKCDKYKVFKGELKAIHKKIQLENDYYDFYKKRVLSCMRYGGR